MKTDRLKETREDLKLSQEALAEILGTNQKQIWRWETGKTVPSGDDVKRLAEVLNVSSDYLLGLTNNPVPESFSAVQLTPKERAVISALRQGDNYAAIKVITGDE